MFLTPSLVGGGWPWELNPPEGKYAQLARMEPYIGVWLLGLGTVSLCAARENDLRRIRCVLAGGIALPLLQGVAVGRYAATVRWSHPATWLFGGALLVLLVLSATGLARLRRLDRGSGRPAAASAPTP